MDERYPHPSRQPLLPLAMLVAVVIGVISLRSEGKYATFVAGFAFAWFLASFLLYGFAWIQRDHAEWRDSRREAQPTTAAGRPDAGP